MATAEVKEEQKVYVCLHSDYEAGKHILSWALRHFSKDETKIVATSIIPPLSSSNYSDALLNQWRERSNETLDKHVAQCAIHKYKLEKLIHNNDDVVEGILELIDLRAIKNLVMAFSPNSELVKKKANPSCKIWFIQNGNMIYIRYSNSDLTESSSEERIRRAKLHQKEIEKTQKRENERNDILKRENEQLKLENQLLRNRQNDEELDKKKQQLGKLISDLQIAYNKLKQEHNDIKKALELSCQFSLSELKQATQNFSDSSKIGEGVFGCVYKGSLRNTTVAIKKLNSESLLGLSQFQQEVAILTRVRHPNIVNLIGSCSEISAFVYEFLPNGSLENRLACANNTSSLTWQSRTRIIGEICLGLVFLHSNEPHLVIHGDLKPDNILLDANFMSKLSDFGISKIIKQSDTNTTAVYHTTHLAGTFPYVDPEFLTTGKLTPKSDVYSFGIIMLRLLTGKSTCNIASEVQNAMRTSRLMSIVDQSAGKWPSDLANKLAELGMSCAAISRAKRPDINQVWAKIEPLVKVLHN